MELKPRNLALIVAIPAPDTWPATGCVAWIDSADRICGKPRTQDYLCTRHHNVAQKRAVKTITEARARRARRDREQSEKLPQYQKDLARVEAEIARRDPEPPTRDRAAYGGVGCSTTARYQAGLFSDANVRRMGHLLEQRENLIQRVSAAERASARISSSMDVQ